MANWPDAGRYALSATGNQCNSGATETQLPYYAFYPLSNGASFHGGGLFTQLKAPTSVTIQIPGTTPGNNIALLYRGILVDQVWAGTSTFFYDVNDGTYMAVDCTNGQSWQIIVLGTAVTVIPITSTGVGRPTYGQLWPLGTFQGGTTVGSIFFQPFAASGTLTVPPGVTAMKLRGTAAGAGGGGSPTGSSLAGGSGGGGGEYGEGAVTVVPGSLLTFTLGAGGPAGIGANNGTNGGDTTVIGTGVSVTLKGGHGGIFATSGTPVSGGAGGTGGSGLSFLQDGGVGGQGVTYGSGLAKPGEAGGAFGSFISVLGGSPGQGGGGGANGVTGQPGNNGIMFAEWVA